MIRQSTKNKALAVANNLYEEFEARGDFTTEEFRAALGLKLPAGALDTHEDFLDAIAEITDRARRKKIKVSGEIWLYDVGGVYALGDNRRVAKRLASWDQFQEWLAINTANRQSVDKANDEAIEEAKRLQPYWARAGVTKEEALAAFREVNPEPIAVGV